MRLLPPTVLLVFCTSSFLEALYQNLGCYKDGEPRAISGEKEVFLKLPVSDVVKKCYERARSLGYHFFGVEVGAECWTSRDAGQTYAKYGKTNGCKDGGGGGWMLNVYKIRKSQRFSSWITSLGPSGSG